MNCRIWKKSSIQGTLAIDQHVKSNLLTKKKDSEQEHRTVNSNKSAEKVRSRSSFSKQHKESVPTQQLAYRRVSNLCDRSVPITRGAEKNIFKFNGG